MIWHPLVPLLLEALRFLQHGFGSLQAPTWIVASFGADTAYPLRTLGGVRPLAPSAFNAAVRRLQHQGGPGPGGGDGGRRRRDGWHERDDDLGRSGKGRGNGRWADALHTDLPFLCEVEPSQAQGQARCPEGWTQEGQSCYKYSGEGWCQGFLRSEDQCAQTEGAHLASIDDREENDVAQRLCIGKPCWVGLREVPAGSGNWQWTDGTSLNFTNWEQGEPNDWDGQEEEFTFLNPYWEDGEIYTERYPSCWDDHYYIALINAAAFWSIWFVGMSIYGCIACCYHRKVTALRPSFPSTQDLAQGPLSMASTPSPTFRFGLFGCFEDCSACMFGCFCMPVRAADTYATTGLASFCKVISLYFAFLSLGIIIDVTMNVLLQIIEVEPLGEHDYDLYFRQWFTSLLFAAFAVRRRQELQQLFGSGGRERATCCQDFLIWWCCGPCAAVQEARQVDAAEGVSVKCPCALTRELPYSVQMMLGTGLPQAMVHGGAMGAVGQAVVVGQPMEGQPGQADGKAQQGVVAQHGVVVGAAPGSPVVGNFTANGQPTNCQSPTANFG